MRVLLTGAAGFLGSRAAKHLLEGGHEVHALVRAGSDRRRLETLAPGVRVVTGDLLEVEAARTIVEGARPEACVHLAWYAVPGKYLDASENLDHLAATLRLFGSLRDAGCARLVTGGTCFEYDTSFGLLSETTTTAPRSPYAATKLSVFQVLEQAARSASMSFAHLRFFYQYGPWEHEARLVPSVVRALLRGEEARVTAGAQVRDFLHVDDVGSAIRAVLEADVRGAVNVGSGVPVRVRQIVEAAAEACGRPELVRFGALPYRQGDPPFVCAKPSVLERIGWSPSWSLSRGMRDTVDYWGQEVRLGR